MTVSDTALAAPISYVRARNGSIDLMRLIAAAVIVLFHARAPGGVFMTPAVAAFSAILAFNACNRAPSASSSAQRARRFLQPFLIWVALFGLLRSLDAFLSGQPIGETLIAWFPPRGTMHHLWFLPFGFAVAILAPPALAWLRMISGDPACIMFLVLGACGWLLFWQGMDLPQGIRIFGLYLPSVMLGMALVLVPNRPEHLLYAFLTVLLLGLGLRNLGVNNSAQIFLGLPVVIAALALPLPDGRLTRLAAELSLAVYLIHPLIMAIILRLTPLAFGTPELGLTVLAASAAAGVATLKSPARRLFL